MATLSLQAHKRILSAIMFRGLKEEYGRYSLGIVWMFLETIIMAIIMSILFGYRGRTAVGGVEFAVFFCVGFVLFRVFRMSMNQTEKVPQKGRQIMVFPGVIPLHMIMATAVLEMLKSILVIFVLYAGMLYLGYDAWPNDIMVPVLAMVLLAILGVSVGMMFTVLEKFAPELAKLLDFFRKPLMIISAVIFPMTIIPVEFYPYLDWNPIMHAMELTRDAWIVGYETPVGSMDYMVEVTVIMGVIGLALYSMFRDLFAKPK